MQGRRRKPPRDEDANAQRQSSYQSLPSQLLHRCAISLIPRVRLPCRPAQTLLLEHETGIIQYPGDAPPVRRVQRVLLHALAPALLERGLGLRRRQLFCSCSSSGVLLLNPLLRLLLPHRYITRHNETGEKRDKRLLLSCRCVHRRRCKRRVSRQASPAPLRIIATAGCKRVLF
jgi:hypothetical protein